MANPRMKKVLGFDARVSEDPQFPMSKESIRSLWPFFNHQKSTIAIFDWMMSHRKKDAEQNVEAGLKTFKLYLRTFKEGKTEYMAVIAQLLRQGDLMQDSEARQTLYKSISHEIRTATTALQGYMQMLEGHIGSKESEILQRMKINVSRLDKVVERLSDFKSKTED